MKLSKTLQFFLGMAAVLVISAFLAPLISPLLSYPFDRILSRTVMVLSIAWILFFLSRQGGLNLKRYGLFWEGNSGSRLLTAFCLGFGTLAVLTVVGMLFGVRSWQFTFHETVWPLKLAKYIASALFIGLLEEFIFRGLLFRSLAPRLRLLPALVVTNLIYSLSHFLRYSGNETFSDPSFHSSFHLYLEILKPFTLPAQIWPGAVGLFLFGMVLSYSYLRTENLIFPIGLHAGAVFFMKLDRWFIQVNSETHKIIFGGADFHASLLGWLFILIMGVGVRCLLKNEREGA